MEVQGLSAVYIDRFLAQYPVLVQPEYRGTDFLTLNGSLGTSGWNDLYWDAVADCVYPQPQLVWHDNTFSGGPSAGGSWPVVSWGAISTSGGISVKGQSAAPHNFLEVQGGYTSMVQPPVTSLGAAALLSPVCQGFTFYYSLGAEQTDPANRTSLSIAINLGTDALASDVWYDLVLPVGADAYVLKSTDNAATFPTKLGSIKTQSRKEQMTRPFTTQDQIHLEIRYVASTLEITIGDMLQPWTYREIIQVGAGNDVAWSINEIRVLAENFDQIRFSAHPTKFIKALPQSGNPPMQSGQQALGFVPQNDPAFIIHYAPDQQWSPLNDGVNKTTGFAPAGCSATATEDTGLSAGAVLVYDLAFTNPPSTAGMTTYQGVALSDWTAAVRAVSYQFAPITLQVVSTPFQVLPDEIEVTWLFDFNTLQIRSSATLGFQNFDGVAAALFDANGHMAVTIDMALAPGIPTTYFTGIINTGFDEVNPGGGRSRYMVQCEDNWLPINTEIYGLPFFDAWNLYYAAYFLAQLGGVDRSRMNFSGLIPDDPYQPTPGDTAGTNTYFLPVGPAGTPITRFPGPQVKGDILLKFCKQTGFVAFFDQFARLNFTKFIPPTPVPQFIFTDVATGSLSELWNMTYSGTLRETRNSVTTLGIDPVTGIPVVGHAEDPNIFNDINNPAFKGYVDPLIWVDQQFVDPDFAQAAAGYMLSYLQWPGRTLQATTWMPLAGFVSPLTVVGIDVPRSGAYGKSFIVYGAKYRMRKDEAPSFSLAGRWFFGS